MILQSKPGRFRYTVIFTATAKGLESFESLDAMPPVLRARCVRALEGRDSGTVIIAGEAEEAATEAAACARPPAPQPEAAGTGRVRVSNRMIALGLHLLVAALAAAAWFLASRG